MVGVMFCGGSMTCRFEGRMIRVYPRVLFFVLLFLLLLPSLFRCTLVLLPSRPWLAPSPSAARPLRPTRSHSLEVFEYGLLQLSAVVEHWRRLDKVVVCPGCLLRWI